MRKSLYTGEVAQLLGITPKALRHYQKIGLLHEPERSATGYRLYNAQHLLRLYHIKRLQEFGLSLQQIKIVLGDSCQKRTLREVLQSLDEELGVQIHSLEERRRKIRALLDNNPLESVEHLPVASPTFQQVRQMAGELTININPVFWEQEARMDALLDAFHWPGGLTDTMQQLISYLAEHPDLYQDLLSWGERFAALTSLDEDAPEVVQLITIFKQNEKFLSLIQMMKTLAQNNPRLEEHFENALSELLTGTLSPAQKRVLKAIYDSSE